MDASSLQAIAQVSRALFIMTVVTEEVSAEAQVREPFFWGGEGDVVKIQLDLCPVEENAEKLAATPDFVIFDRKQTTLSSNLKLNSVYSWFEFFYELHVKNNEANFAPQ